MDDEKKLNKEVNKRFAMLPEVLVAIESHLLVTIAPYLHPLVLSAPY
jgi:hypothetical protein